MSRYEKLYDITFPLSEDKTLLYFQGNHSQIGDRINIEKGESLDFGTYFNSFSICKWLKYTTISKLKVILKLTGKFYVDFYGMDISGEEEILRLKCDGSIERDFHVMDFSDFDLVGIRLTALSDESALLGGEYQGLFEDEREVKIGITICTFRREKYLLPNLDKLKFLTESNPNINVMVIDNGRTLEETHSDVLQVIHNPNFGGSGGFTRGLIEQVNQGKVSHVILMDDDVVIELSAFDRLYSMLRHMKPNYHCNFFAGAMLNVDKPTTQTENTAYWNRIISKPFGVEFDLTDKNVLCYNEYPTAHENQYAGWWFCCVPIEVVKRIGYPLPNFIKGDDIEYGLRNGREILSMNGIGVWHEAFSKKLNPVMKYFSDRGMLIVNHFAAGCNEFTFMTAILLRILKRFIKHDLDSIRMLEIALKDLNGGYEQITSIRADDKFATLKNMPLNKNIFSTILSILKLAFYHCDNYDELDEKYKNFRDNNLLNQDFWINYMIK